MTEISGEELMHLFRYCFNLMRRRYHQTVHGKVGTRQGQGKILSVLRREDGIGQKELAEQLQIRPASLSELLDKMQKRLDSAQGQRERQTKNQYFSDRRWERHISADDRSTAGYGEYCFWRIERG